MIHGIIDDQRKLLSEFRKKFQSAGFANAETLVPQRGNPVMFPMGRAGRRNGEDVVDVCGCPIGFGSKENQI